MKKLIIFDCDGVLVDSEIIAERLGAETLTNLGYPHTTEECIRRFTGFDEKTVQKILFDEYGVDIFVHLTEEILAQAFKKELTSLMEPLLQTLKKLNIHRCVASNSRKSHVTRVLELTDQIQFFDHENIFTSSQVEKGKPAPDLFLFAADRMGYAPEDCLIIEDSMAGIQAARAAGMDVIAFLGGGHAGYDWYKERIQTHSVPIAHSTTEIMTMIDEHFRKSA